LGGCVMSGRGTRYSIRDRPMRYRMEPSRRRWRAVAGSPRIETEAGCLRQFQTPVNSARRSTSRLRSRALSQHCAAGDRISPTSRSIPARYPPSICGFTSSRARYRRAKPAPMAKSQPSSGFGCCAFGRAGDFPHPFMIIVPCHRCSKRQLCDKISPMRPIPSAASYRSRAGRHDQQTLFDVLLPVAPPRPQV